MITSKFREVRRIPMLRDEDHRRRQLRSKTLEQGKKIMKWQADFERRLEARAEHVEVLISNIFREKSLLLLNRPILKFSPNGLNFD